MSKTVVTIVVLVVLVLAGAMYVQSQRSIDDTPSPDDDDVACTEEAMQCPDGSYVGRTGPDCEFAPCPTPLGIPAPTPIDKVVCTEEAMLCPDGSYVGRTGPNCQFVCP